MIYTRRDRVVLVINFGIYDLKCTSKNNCDSTVNIIGSIASIGKRQLQLAVCQQFVKLF